VRAADVSQKFVVSLVSEARRRTKPPIIDLAIYIEEHFSRDHVRVIERGFGGRSVTVEMDESFVPKLQDRIPFATVAPEVELKLLSYP
jgi:hypothetical protein